MNKPQITRDAYSRNLQYVEYLPVEVLEKYAEFDRAGKDAFDHSAATIKELENNLPDAITEPVIIEYFRYENKALLIEGNHRLRAAINAGIENLPTVVVTAKRNAPTKAKPVAGMEPNEYGYIPSMLKPSQIGLPGLPVEPNDIKDSIYAAKGSYLQKQIKTGIDAAVEDVIELPRYNNIGKMEGVMLFNKFKDIPREQYENGTLPDEDMPQVEKYKPMEYAIFEKLEQKGILYLALNTFSSYRSYIIYDSNNMVFDFVQAVKARQNTLKSVKKGVDMFPFMANIPQMDKLKKEIEIENKFEEATRILDQATESIVPAVIESDTNTLQSYATNPGNLQNVVLREVKDRHGETIVYLSFPHNKTRESIITAAKHIETEMNASYSDASNVNSRIVATDETGNPAFAISPNLMHIEPIGSDEAKAIHGDMEAFSRVKNAVQEIVKRDNIQKVVLDEGDGIVINDLFNQWNNIKNEREFAEWSDKIKNTNFGTYGSVGLMETIKKFNPKLNDTIKRNFYTEIETALNIPKEQMTFKPYTIDKANTNEQPNAVDKAKAIIEHLPKGGELKAVTEVKVSDNGEEVSYGTKTSKTSITVKGLSADDIKQEIEFEKKILAKSKTDAQNFNEDEIRSAKGLTNKEKEDAIKMHKQSLINNEQVEKIVIPFYEKHLELLNKQPESKTNYNANLLIKAKIDKHVHVKELDASYKIKPITQTDAMYKQGFRYEATITYPESLGENGNYSDGNLYKEIPNEQEVISDIKKTIKYELEQLNEKYYLSGRDEKIKEALEAVEQSLKEQPKVQDPPQSKGIETLKVKKNQPNNVVLKEKYKNSDNTEYEYGFTFTGELNGKDNVDQYKPFAVGYFGDNAANRYEHATASNDILDVVNRMIDFDSNEGVVEIYNPQTKIKNSFTIYPLANEYTNESVGLKVVEQYFEQTPEPESRIKSSFESNIEALINPETGMAATIAKMDTGKTEKAAFLKRKKLTIEDYNKLDAGAKQELQSEWVKSKEFEELSNKAEQPKANSVGVVVDVKNEFQYVIDKANKGGESAKGSGTKKVNLSDKEAAILYKTIEKIEAKAVKNNGASFDGNETINVNYEKINGKEQRINTYNVDGYQIKYRYSSGKSITEITTPQGDLILVSKQYGKTEIAYLGNNKEIDNTGSFGLGGEVESTAKALEEINKKNPDTVERIAGVKYHGTVSENIESFNIRRGKSGYGRTMGAYFTNASKKAARHGKNLYKVLLNLNKTLDLSKYKDDKYEEFLDELPMSLKKKEDLLRAHKFYNREYFSPYKTLEDLDSEFNIVAALKKKGYDSVSFMEDEGTTTIVFDANKIQRVTDNLPQKLAEAYHKAKADGSNEQLVKAVEDLINTNKFQNGGVAGEKKSDNESILKNEKGEDIEFYHGTPAEFEDFDLSKLGENTQADSAKEGIFFSNNKNVAESYRKQAEYDNPNIKQAEKELKNLTRDELISIGERILHNRSKYYYEGQDNQEIIDDIILDIKEDSKDYYPDRNKYIEKLSTQFYNRGIEFKPYIKQGKLISAKLKMSNPFVFDANGDVAEDIGLTKLIKTAKESGHDGVIIKNIYDSVSFDEKGNDTEPSDIAVVFDINQVIIIQEQPKATSFDVGGEVKKLSNEIIEPLGKDEYPDVSNGIIAFHSTSKDGAEKIKSEGLKTGLKPNGLTPNSISFFVERRPSERFGETKLKVELPPLKLLNDEKQFGYLIEFVEKKLGKTANSREINTFENLREFGGYDGIITKANGGTEIRILNPDKISEINRLNFNLKADSFSLGGELSRKIKEEFINDINKESMDRFGEPYFPSIDNPNIVVLASSEVDKMHNDICKANKCETNVYNVVKENPDKYYPVRGYFINKNNYPVEHWWLYDRQSNKYLEITPDESDDVPKDYIKGYVGVVNKDINDEIVNSNKVFDVDFFKSNQRSDFKKIISEEQSPIHNFDLGGEVEFTAKGGNKVVDEKTGEPKIMYHETDAEFTVFDESKKSTGQGNDFGAFWFSEQATGYFAKPKKNKHTVKISIKNPATDADLKDAQLLLPDDLYKDKLGKSKWYAQYFKSKGFDGIILKNGEYAVFNKSQILPVTKFENGGNINNDYPAKSLEQEAKKYKSADEFVRAQKMVYHGSNAPLKKFNNKQGTFFTDDMMMADGYASGENVYEGYLNLKNPLVIDAKGRKWDNLETPYGSTTQQIAQKLDTKKYDGIVFENIKDSWIDDVDYQEPSTIYYAVKAGDSFLNESQLIDLWNKYNTTKFENGGNIVSSDVKKRNSIVSEKTWYHGSNKPVNKFLFSLIGVNSERITNYHGYGIYFVDKIERAKSYGDIITSVSIDNNSDFLIGKVTPEQMIKVYNQLKAEGVKLRDNDEGWFNNPTYDNHSILNNVEEFYDYFMRAYRDSFKNIKDVTEFLLRSGIDGMYVTNDVGDNILVVFNEKVINIIPNEVNHFKKLNDMLDESLRNNEFDISQLPQLGSALPVKQKDFTYHLAQDFINKIKHDKRSVDKLALTYGLVDTMGNLRLDVIKELIELAVVITARYYAQQANKLSTEEIYEHITDLYRQQPTLSYRTSLSVLHQQYSTSIPLGYLCGLYTGVNKPNNGDVYFEPTAGNGALTVAGKCENFDVNEIDKLRLKNLLAQGYRNVTSMDASEPFPLEYKNKYDAVVCNPPFGTNDVVMQYKGLGIKKLEYIIAINSLETMKHNGKAAVIMGSHMGYDSEGRVSKGQQREFFTFLFTFYNVEDIINIDSSKLYARQGTSWDIKLILINGRKEKPQGYPPLENKELAVTEPMSSKVVQDWHTLYKRIMR